MRPTTSLGHSAPRLWLPKPACCPGDGTKIEPQFFCGSTDASRVRRAWGVPRTQWGPILGTTKGPPICPRPGVGPRSPRRRGGTHPETNAIPAVPFWGSWRAGFGTNRGSHWKNKPTRKGTFRIGDSAAHQGAQFHHGLAAWVFHVQQGVSPCLDGSFACFVHGKVHGEQTGHHALHVSIHRATASTRWRQWSRR